MPSLSIVVAAYDMQREAPRTVLSLLPPLQRGVADVEYEIIVVDNGSPVPLDLGRHVRDGAKPPVRLVRISRCEAQVSPTRCINAAAKETMGDWLMICIDGARLASSHLVRRTVEVLSRHPKAFTFVGSRHLGAKPQMQSVQEGYDQGAEDELLRSVAWQTDLDELFRISVWANAHDQRERIRQNESNAFAMARSTWDALGGYDEGFTRPGGGLCNLELFERAVNRKPSLGTLNVLLYGESTFHQVHGGAATSLDGYFKQSQEEYTRVTGRTYARPSYPFLADLGETHDRMAAVGRFLIDHESHA
ncbi:MAG: glycosyltransferase [Gammaproteobacteria bacterium]|nr:glycosyltransferase [Gammaproteobacteria bacterium]